MQRNSILEAIEDGAVDQEEYNQIMLHFARTQMPAERRQKVEAALGDGHMDAEDKELLLGLVRGYFLVFVQLFEKYGTLIERYTALIEKVSALTVPTVTN
eukprot:SAG31_NODE_5214_length_2671_cov_1.306376_2_plen_100_part_00